MKNDFFLFPPFLFLPHSLSSLSQWLQNAERNPNTKSNFLINQMKSEKKEKKEKKKERKERDPYGFCSPPALSLSLSLSQMRFFIL